MIGSDILGERSRLTPQRTALLSVSTGESYTYQELDNRAAQCAQMWLKFCGLKKGDRAAVLANNRVEIVDAFFASAKSGIILVPLNTRLTTHELEVILRDSTPQALLYEKEFSDVVRELKSSLKIRHWIAFDAGSGSGDPEYSAYVNKDHESDTPVTKCEPEEIHCLLYTSGTTGLPKGVMLPHRMIAWNAYNTAICWELNSSDVAPVFTPMYHAGGLTVFLTPIFLVGGKIVLHQMFDATEVWRMIERERATVIFGVPTIFKMLLESPEFKEVDLSAVRYCISGGAPLALYIMEAYQKRGIVFKQGYGLTEVGVNCFSMTVEESKLKPGSIGKPMLFTEAKLMGPDTHVVPRGEVGELLLRGPHVSKGYWNNPRATAEALDAQGWFHTGDLARRDSDGFFYVAGRQKDMIISGGVNVYPAEIEGALLLHPQVQDAAVIGIPDPKWGEKGVAFVVMQGGLSISLESLADFLSHRLAKFKIPKEFVLVESLPKTPYGKVLKDELRRKFLDQK